jgi:hypothetical protein
MSTTKRSSKKKAGSAASRPKTASKADVSQAEAVSHVISPALQELIGRAITDSAFRKLLFTDRARAIKGFKLTKIDQAALARVKPEHLEEQASVFAKKLEIRIFVQITIHF